MIRNSFPFVLLTFILSSSTFVLSAQQTVPGNSIRELSSKIEGVLADTGTPGVGIAIVSKDGPIWIGGIGKANLKNDVPVSEHTMFRIASVSKMFVGIAILQLVEEGELHLDDRVRDLVPEVEFENHWEATYPVKVVHLLEHTTGWDEMHLVEFAHNEPTPIPLADALKFHPHSRKSRWVPGTRVAYTNSSYAVAAYIIEKITEMAYEDYVANHILKSIGMNRTSFFNDRLFQQYGTTSYNSKGVPFDYRNILYRPAGGVNSSPADMARFIQMFIHRGVVDSTVIISGEALQRMETPTSSLGAKVGLQVGYGLGNVSQVHNGVTYQGHDGVIDGCFSELAYYPSLSLGHFISINSDNTEAFFAIKKLVREFVVNMNESTPHDAKKNPSASQLKSGYYVSINPRNQSSYFIDRLFDIYRVEEDSGTVTKSGLLPGRTEVFRRISDSTFYIDNSNVIGLVETVDPLAGKVLCFEKLTMKRISSVVVFGQLGFLVVWLGMMTMGVLLASVALVRIIIGKSRHMLHVSIVPASTSIVFFLFIILFVYGRSDHETLFSAPGIISVPMLVLSLLFAVGPPLSFLVLFRKRKKGVHPFVYWFMIVLSLLSFMAVLFLLSYGVIPFVTWA